MELPRALGTGTPELEDRAFGLETRRIRRRLQGLQDGLVLQLAHFATIGTYPPVLECKTDMRARRRAIARVPSAEIK
jgi:hypothetical protein